MNKPLFIVRSTFHLPVAALRHPLRIILILLISTFFLPELRYVVWNVFALQGVANTIAVFGFLTGLIISVPLFLSWWRSRAVLYKFYKNEMVYRPGIIPGEEMALKYKTFENIRIKSSLLQKYYGLATIEIKIRHGVGRVKGHAISIFLHDIRNAAGVVQKIDQIVQDYNRRREAAQKAAEMKNAEN